MTILAFIALAGLWRSMCCASIAGFQMKGSVSSILGTSFGNPGINATYDYIIVGGGTAGNTIATRLAQDPAGYSVAVIETGSFYELDNGNHTTVTGYDYFSPHPASDSVSFVDYNIPTVPQAGYNNRTIHYSQGRTFGGSSALNYMAYHRPTVGAFKMWADKIHDQDWTWEHVLPFYKKSVDFSPPDYTKINPAYNITYDDSALTPAGGPLQVSYGNHMYNYGLPFQSGFDKIGIHAIPGLNSGRLIGYAPFTGTIDPTAATRSSSESSFLEMAMQTTSLKIYQTTTVKQLLFDENKRATGVRVQMQGIYPQYEYVLSARREVIVSAGAFHSPQLLMVSGIGPKTSLEDLNIPVVQVSEGVGQNMWDQPWVGLAWKSKYETETQIILGNPMYTNPAVEQYLANQSGPIAGIGGGESVGWEKLPPPSRSALSNSTLAQLAQFPADWPEIEYIPLAYSPVPDQISPTDQYITTGACLVAPLSRGSMTISSSDFNDDPVINPNWLSNDGDLEVAVQAFKRVVAWVNASGVASAPFLPQTFLQTDAQIIEYIKANGNMIFHPTSSCAMGPDGDPMAVLDSKARVRGVSGLRVVDASAFPICPPGHPQSTVYMLAEKIADYILTGS